jgi:hypothetical protein
MVFIQLAKDYEQVKQPEGDYEDAARTENYFKEGTGKTLAFLNCKLFLGGSCSCKDCCNNHKAVLASDQYKCFGEILEKTKDKFIHSFLTSDPRNERIAERLAFQSMCQYYINDQKLNMDVIEIRTKHLNDPKEYLRLYVKAAKGYLKKNPQGLKYVRSDGNSCYAQFESAMGCSKLSPCDTIRSML